MLSIRSITLTDFGPFKDEQRIDFPAARGVSIIYGENMRGKTTLLNAIRYALFGKVIARGATQVALHQIGNWETASETGRYGFKVVLAFDHEGSSYQLTRQHRPRPGIKVPQTDSDYEEDCYLQRGATVLGPGERDSELARIMPETVSRFFLFDGELLQQYEELLRNESDMGRNIKEAIERILGVPVLTNGRTDLGELAKDAQKREARAAQKNQKTQSLGNNHEALLKQFDALQAETDRLTKRLAILRVNKASQEDQLRKTEKTKALLDERGRVQDEIANADSRIKEKEERRKSLLGVAWKGMLIARLKATLAGLEQELAKVRETYQAGLISGRVADQVRQAISEGSCATCGQELSVAARTRLNALIEGTVPPEDRDRAESEIQRLSSRMVALKRIEAASNVDVLQEVQDAIDELKIKRATTADRLTDIREQTKDLDDTAIRRLYSEHEKTVTEIGFTQDGIKKQESQVQGIKDNIAKVEAEIARFADSSLVTERARKNLCEQLKALFAGAVDAYRERLRGKVEADATTLFLKLTSEPEYKALSINESYGLTIVHQDGTAIPVRSAGAEHIVALSLMGALQRNAPLRGPIVMDSPFGRLDDAHTAKVVQALASMADQVMLLVYESELDPSQARNELGGSLRKEYRIARRSARHSVLETIS